MTPIHWNPKTRRHFLRSAAGLIVTLPALSSLLTPEEAKASGNGRRFAFLWNGHGQVPAKWFPDPSRYTFSVKEAQYRAALLKDVQGPISPIFHNGFDPFREKMTLMSRINFSTQNPNHNCEALLLGGTREDGGKTARSLDHVLASALGEQSPTNLMNFWPDGGGQSTRYLSVKDGEFETGVPRASSLFASLFPMATGSGSSGSASGSGSSAANSSSSALLTQKKAVDYVKAQYDALKNNPRLSKLDQARLQEHFDLMSQLQDKTMGSVASTYKAAPSCDKIEKMPDSHYPSSPPPPGSKEAEILLARSKDFDFNLRQMIDLMAFSLKCNKVRVSTLQMHPYDYFAGHLAFIPEINTSNTFHEGYGHDRNGPLADGRMAIEKYFADRVLQLLSVLNEVEDSTTGQTYLDNSIVFWGNDMGVDHTNNHSQQNLPVALFGNAGGSLKSGYYIDYGEGTGAPQLINGNDIKDGRAINQLHVSILQAMGVAESVYAKNWGGTGFGIYGQRHPKNADSTKPLPFFFVG